MVWLLANEVEKKNDSSDSAVILKCARVNNIPLFQSPDRLPGSLQLVIPSGASSSGASSELFLVFRLDLPNKTTRTNSPRTYSRAETYDHIVLNVLGNRVVSFSNRLCAINNPLLIQARCRRVQPPRARSPRTMVVPRWNTRKQRQREEERPLARYPWHRPS